MSVKSLFAEILPLIQKYATDNEFMEQAGDLKEFSRVLGEHKAFIVLLRILFGHMLVKWGVDPRTARVTETLSKYFPKYCPQEIQSAITHFNFVEQGNFEGASSDLFTPDVYSDLYELLLSVESNKSGSFYTPDYIAKSMCRAIINQAGNDYVQSFPVVGTLEVRGEIPSIFSTTDLASDAEIRDFLISVTICDPACGTGKFLLASAEYLAILWENVILQNGFEPILDAIIENGQSISIVNATRQYIIEHSLFGVEKDPLAAEICRLRLLAWYLASMSADHLANQFRLPNLDHIKVGNALIGCSMPTCEDNPYKRGIGKKRISNSQKYLALLAKSGVIVPEEDLSRLLPFHWPAEFPHGFTILVSNPPYGNLLLPLEKTILRRTDPMVEDIYVNFLLRVARGDIQCQHAAFLTPKSFLLRQNYRDFREVLFERTTPYGIWDVGSKKFKGALNEVQVLFFHSQPTYTPTLRIGSSIGEETMRYVLPGRNSSDSAEVPLDTWNVCFNPACPGFDGQSQFYWYTHESTCPLCNAQTNPLFRIRTRLDFETYPLIHKIEETGDMNFLNARDFPDMKRGEEDRGLKRVKAALGARAAASSNPCGFLGARNDFTPFILRPQRFFDMDSIELQKDPRFYAGGPKLLIKHNSIAPTVAFTRDPMCFTAAVYSLLHPEEDLLKYLCGLLNSSLISLYCVVGINNQATVTMNLNQYMIRHLPIVPPRSAGSHYRRIIDFTDNIISSLSAGRQWNDETSSYYTKLNCEVLCLYGVEDAAILTEQTVAQAMKLFHKVRQ